MTTPLQPDGRIRILVAGLGSIGQRHARLLGERDEVELLLCERVTSRLDTAQQFQRRPAAVFTDYAAALAARPRLVVICTPNPLHVPMGLRAVAAGADLLVEKPLADTVSEARRLVVAATAARRRLHVGYMLRYDPGLRTLKRLVDAGAVGRLCGGRAMVGSYVTLLNSRERDKETRPGSLVVDYSHEIDYVRWFFGEVAQVQAMAATLGARERRARPNLFQASLRMKSGELVQLHLDYLQYPQRRIFEIYGDDGTLSYDFMSGEIRHYASGRDLHWSAHDVAPLAQRVDDLFRAEHAAVLGNASPPPPPPVDGRDALATLRVAERALAAAAVSRSPAARRPARLAS